MAQAVRTILPMCVLLSISSWAFAAASSGKVLKICGFILPSLSSGQTCCSSSLAINAFSATVRERSVEPVCVRRLLTSASG